jgi:hypothetical protein
VDLSQLDLTAWLLIGGAATVVLALLLYWLPVSAIKIPAVLLSILGGLGVGMAAGIILLGTFGYHWKPQPSEEGPPRDATAGMRPPMGGMMGGPGGGRPGGGGPGGGGRANPKTTLASLITKLDLLAGKQLSLDLNDEQKQKVLEQLKDLGKEELNDTEAQTRLDALLKLLEGDKKTLEAVGFNWPGESAGRGGRGDPLKSEESTRRLKDLQDRLGKSGTP